MTAASVFAGVFRWSGIILALATFTVHRLAAWGFAADIYNIYSNAVYPVIRNIYDHTLGLLPFPFIYAAIAIFIVAIAVTIRRAIFIFSTKGKSAGTKQLLLRLINLAGWLYFLFYFSWGFNYYGPGLSSRLRLPEVKPDSVTVVTELENVTDIVNQLRLSISADTSALNSCPDWTGLEQHLRSEESVLLATLGQRTPGRIRIRALQPEGLLLRFSTAGVYVPYSFEGHVDPGLHCLQWPFTMAHEMAHGYGFTDEGECNFISLLVCSRSDQDFVRYSAVLSYWKYLYFDVRNLDEKIAGQNYSRLSQGVRSDLKAIRKASDKYPDIMPKLRDMIYDKYLKSHGVSRGLASYNEIVDLMYKWKKSGRPQVLVQ